VSGVVVSRFTLEEAPKRFSVFGAFLFSFIGNQTPLFPSKLLADTHAASSLQEFFHVVTPSRFAGFLRVVGRLQQGQPRKLREVVGWHGQG
jgi:hypothetical protein